jgi:hypothetical protein
MKTITFDKFIEKDDAYFSEGHLQGWFDEQYHGKTKTEVKYLLENVHDSSCEIDNCENEIGRKLTDKESELLIKRFCKAVRNSIEYKRGIAIGWYDSLGKLN